MGRCWTSSYRTGGTPPQPGGSSAGLLKKTRTVPRVVVTDKLRSYGAAHREVVPSVEHRCHKGLNNRAENSHQPTRQRERAMKGFDRSAPRSGSCPRSAASHLTSGPIAT
ncbi:DDE-type integrase/transposase/recombinase [Streptomyces sp. NPDC006527]|uniref:DDE-type integrase/transposase/recombinase n=1 Tax=Streptomyces sp. NPDC006527 TaxID=3364749 RepID=UPI00369A4841